jgi:hypothetical protein
MGKVYGKEGREDRRLTVIATRDELNLVTWEGPVLITGIGALNVMEALKDYPRDTPIVNVGYCGAGRYEIGTRLPIDFCDLYHPVAGEYNEPEYELPDADEKYCSPLPGELVTCHTITDFGGNPEMEHCVFDMELAFILGMGFTNVQAVKVVSDNCSMKEYEETIKKNG